jgi:hypothetical protein
MKERPFSGSFFIGVSAGLLWCSGDLFPLTPALSPRGGEGEREPISVLFKTEFD